MVHHVILYPGRTLLVQVTRNPSVFLMVHHVVLYSGSYVLSPGNQESKRLSYGASCHTLDRTLLVPITRNLSVFLMVHHIIFWGVRF